MNLVVLIPSAAYRQNAGARIRYGRMIRAMAELGISLSLREIDAFDPLKARCDFAVVSKVYDVRGLVAAAALARRGIHVGVDLFDDYFSDERDGRLVRQRNWLRQILSFCDFAICSTPPLAGVLRSYRRDIPVHVVNDPAPATDIGLIASLVASKLAVAQLTKTIRLCWFGIGDNPYFSVGINNISAFSDMLSQLTSTGMAVELALLTNRRALDAAALAKIIQLPVPTIVEEWSELRERKVLENSIACFLPVSAQSFSTAKSLNRGVTALTSGCQILSAGYPLYSALDSFIYRNAKDFLADLDSCQLRVSSETLDALEAQLGTLASVTREGAALASFMNDVGSRETKKRLEPAKPIYLFNGVATSHAAHATTKEAGGLSIGMPFTGAHLEFDVIVRPLAGGQVTLLVSESSRSKLKPGWRKRFKFACKIGQRKYWAIEAMRADQDAQVPSLPLPLQLATYQPWLNSAVKMVSDVFGPGVNVVSEGSTLPFEHKIES